MERVAIAHRGHGQQRGIERLERRVTLDEHEAGRAYRQHGGQRHGDIQYAALQSVQG